MRSSVKNKIIWTIALPIIFGNLAQTLIALTATAVLGRVSAVALGASMMAGIYYGCRLYRICSYGIYLMYKNICKSTGKFTTRAFLYIVIILFCFAHNIERID